LKFVRDKLITYTQIGGKASYTLFSGSLHNYVSVQNEVRKINWDKQSIFQKYFQSLNLKLDIRS